MIELVRDTNQCQPIKQFPNTTWVTSRHVRSIWFANKNAQCELQIVCVQSRSPLSRIHQLDGNLLSFEFPPKLPKVYCNCVCHFVLTVTPPLVKLAYETRSYSIIFFVVNIFSASIYSKIFSHLFHDDFMTLTLGISSKTGEKSILCLPRSKTAGFAKLQLNLR